LEKIEMENYNRNGMMIDVEDDDDDDDELGIF